METIVVSWRRLVMVPVPMDMVLAYCRRLLDLVKRAERECSAWRNTCVWSF
jgi:hypothetical protein